MTLRKIVILRRRQAPSRRTHGSDAYLKRGTTVSRHDFRSPPECDKLPAMALEITSLDNAVEPMREGLARHLREPSDEQLRDGP